MTHSLVAFAFTAALLISSPALADQAREQVLQKDCTQIVTIISKMTDDPTVDCTPTKDGTKYAMLIVSGESQTDREDLKQRLFILSVGAVGYVLGDGNRADLTDYCLADAVSLRDRKTYCMPIAKAVELQSATKAGRIGAADLPSKVSAAMQIRAIPKR